MCQILEECIRTNKKMIDERSCYRIPSRESKMRIGYQSDRAQHVHPAIVPVKHRLITRNRFLVASSILTPFRTRNLARERVSFARSLFSHSRFVSENRSRPSSLFGGLDFETTNYETWKLRPFPDARERNFIIKIFNCIFHNAKRDFWLFCGFHDPLHREEFARESKLKMAKMI